MIPAASPLAHLVHVTLHGVRVPAALKGTPRPAVKPQAKPDAGARRRELRKRDQQIYLQAIILPISAIAEMHGLKQAHVRVILSRERTRRAAALKAKEQCS